MRLLFCTTDGANAFNGINAWLVRFLPALRARGHDARALVFTWSAPAQCTTLPLLTAARVPVELVDRARDTEAAIRACLRQVADFSPDIFVPNHVLPALYAAGWVRAAGIPTIGILHNDDAEYRARAELFAGDDEFFRLSAIVAISRGLLRLFASPPPMLTLRCITYGQPLGTTQTTWDGITPLRLIYHGRIVQEQKRICETISACVRVCRSMPGKIEADFFGAGPEESAVQALLQRDDANGHVRFLGHLDPARVAALLPRYHIAVLLSDYEGLGLSVLEAMACGLVPVCHLTASGLPDIIEHEKNGLFVTDRAAAFDTAVARLRSAPDDWRRLSAAARATVEEKFSEDLALAAWENLSTELLAVVRPQRPIAIPEHVALPPPHRLLLFEDRRYPGFARALWRQVRFPSR